MAVWVTVVLGGTEWGIRCSTGGGKPQCRQDGALSFAPAFGCSASSFPYFLHLEPRMFAPLGTYGVPRLRLTALGFFTISFSSWWSCRSFPSPIFYTIQLR